MPPALGGAVAAIGNFDGLHRGHRAVIARAKALAQERGAPAVVLTFEPHPSDFFAKRSAVFRLTPQRDKAQAIEALGLDGVVVLSFDSRLAHMSADAFVADVLVGQLGVSGVVVGYDFHFGAQRAGSPDFLRAAGARRGFSVDIVERIAADDDGALESVSSTATRAALEVGDMDRAAALLGRPWRVSGVVTHGRKLGRTLGYPTANLALDPSCRLRRGVYAVRARVDGVWRAGVANFGSRPMFDDGPPLLEAHLFDFSGDLYGREMAVEMIAFLRDEAKFDTIDALVAQMDADSRAARAAFAVEKGRPRA